MCHNAARSRSASRPFPATAGAPVFLAALTIVLALGLSAKADDGNLQQLRDDVRNGPPAENKEDSGSNGIGWKIAGGFLEALASGGGKSSPDRCSEGGDSEQSASVPQLLLGIGWFGVMLAATPAWGPIQILGDDYAAQAHFPRFPYDNSLGYLATDAYSTVTRPWAARLNAEYLGASEHVQIVSGRLLVSTASRFGVDTQWDYLQENTAGGGHDQLWMGDCNLVFRFAQNEMAEFRTGLGFNWLDDPRQTDLGFNFTYGFDIFPWRPCVLSTDIDWGTLGKAELFRFRSTMGAVVHGVEAYTGYEYLDVGRTHLNCLIGGLRIWF